MKEVREIEEKLYFAYGSNMNLEQMAYRCPAAEVVENVHVVDTGLPSAAGHPGMESLPYCRRKEAMWMGYCGGLQKSVSRVWTTMRVTRIYTARRSSMSKIRMEKSGM